MSQQPTPPSREAIETVHRIGDAEISSTQHDEIRIFEVRGSYSSEVGSTLEKLILRTRNSVGLDLRAFKGSPRAIVPALRSINRAARKRGMMFLLYLPPSSITDILKLSGDESEFTIFKEDGGLQAPSASDVVSPRKRRAGRKEVAPQAIVSFRKDLERADRLESSMEVASRRTLDIVKVGARSFGDFSIDSLYHPHDKVGGDFLHVFDVDSENLGVFIGDVSGHGLEAALIMGMAKKVMEIRAVEGPGDDPAAVLRQVNRDLHGDLDRFTFFTALYGILSHDGQFSYARAGHNYPTLVSPSNSTVRELRAPGIALGMDAGPLFDSTIEMESVRLEPEDALVLYTDGLVEAAHPKLGQFGIHRLGEALLEITREGTPPAAALTSQLVSTLESYLEGSPLGDDLSLITISRSGETGDEGDDPGSS